MNKKIPPSRKGVTLTDEHKKKISISLKKNGHIPPSAFGLKRSDSFKKKVSENNAHYWLGKTGEKTPNWKGGKIERRKRVNYYVNNKWETDILFRIAKISRIRLYKAIKGNYKSGSAVKDLGCTIPELKIYLEKQFKEGMTWDNYGTFGWHIDHKKALSLFDLTDRKQLLEAVHYTNLQPMWAIENIKKGNK